MPNNDSISYYKNIVGFSNYESKWHWDFILNDEIFPTNINFKVYSFQQKVKTIKVLFSKSSFYQGCLVGIELISF